MHINMKVARQLAVTTTLALVFIGNGTAVAQAGSGLGIFENQTDVGSVVPPGVASFDSATGVYTIRSAGANLWVNVDAFHFVWKKVSGDVALTADVKLADAGPTASPHRKALMMFRQSLDSDAMYADAAIHGNGETAFSTGATRATPRRTLHSTLARHSGCASRSVATRSRFSSARTASRCTRWGLRSSCTSTAIFTPA